MGVKKAGLELKNLNSIIVEHSTWAEVQAAMANKLVCVVPIGASCKEHGPHLPLNTDYVQARWLAEQLSLRFSLIIWPVVSAGYYPAFVDYPGSWSISENAFVQCMLDIIESIAKHDENQIVLLNTGISTIKPLEAAIAKSHFSARTTLINVYSGERTEAVIKKVQEQKQGGHADEIETSIMLAIDPASVQMELAAPGLEKISKGPLNCSDPSRPNYCPSGAMGNPIYASPEKGEKILAAILEDVSRSIELIPSD